MDKSINNSLKSLGLKPLEVKFFETSFLLGPSSINEIAKKARLQRSTAYLIAQDLLTKGLIQEDLKKYGRKIFATEPKNLLRMIAAKQRLLRRQEIELEEKLPELEALYSESEVKPKARVYEGINGLLSVWKDILSTNNEIQVWTNQETEALFFNKERHNLFIKERIKKSIPAKVLSVDNTVGRELKKKDKLSLRETKLLPQGKIFSAETYIYDNKIAILDYNKDIFGIIIESQPIADSQRAIFNFTWNMIK